MDEVEHLCDRVAVFRHGRVIGVDSPSGLVRKHGAQRIVRFSADGADLGWLGSVPDVQSVEREGAHVTVQGEGAVLAQVGAALVQHGLAPDDLRVDLPTLEDVYMSLLQEGEA